MSRLNVNTIDADDNPDFLAALESIKALENSYSPKQLTRESSPSPIVNQVMDSILSSKESRSSSRNKQLEPVKEN